MGLRVLIPLFLATVQSVWAGETSWVKAFSFSDPSGKWESEGDCAVNPDARIVVYRRDEHQGYRATTPRRSELVYFDLQTHTEKITTPLPFADPVRLAISADAQTVAVFHKLEFRRVEPMSISIWHPFGESAGLKDYANQVYDLPYAGGRSAAIPGVDYETDPVFSPDTRRVAFSGEYSWWSNETPTPQSGEQDAIGVLDLEEGKTFAIVLPFSTSPTGQHLWHLAWSADGGTIWVTAHGQHKSRTWEKTGAAYVPVQVLPADWTLFRCSVADRTARAIASVPPSILGIDPDGNLIVSDVDRELEGNGPFWWHRTAFGLIPIKELSARAKGKPGAARELALEAKVTKVVPEGGGDFRLERVSIGKAHTYVLGWLDKEHVILEQVSATSLPK